MASNKNQHFVPRCYLRPFSLNDGKTISLYNLDRDATILNSPLKSQCSRDYFYGKDDSLERAIQLVESMYAQQLPALQEPGKKLSSNALTILPRFWFLQQLRTEAASKRTVEMTDDAADLLKHPTETFALEIKQAVQIAMATFAENLDILDDLKIVLVENKTQKPFITSDDPAVMANRWNDLKTGRSQGASYGLSAAGLICLLPLSPSIYCILYDGDIYSIPSKNNWIYIKSTEDVDAFNAIQYLNCFANLYFKDKQDASIFSVLRDVNHEKRPKERHRINYAIKTESSGGYSKYTVVDKSAIPEHSEALIHIESFRVRPSSWPSFLKWRTNGFYYTNGSGAGHIRKAQAVSSHDTSYIKRKAGL